MDDKLTLLAKYFEGGRVINDTLLDALLELDDLHHDVYLKYRITHGFTEASVLAKKAVLAHVFGNYEPLMTQHAENADASQCCQSLDKAFFSFQHKSDFDAFLNGLQNKLLAYRKLCKP